ncbi:MAG: DUF5618 family protein [Bacteroidales bacterium]|nr:DUF5618 family protein [Bacteroidales bacterium]
MKDPMIEIVSDPVAEARRYVENAQTTLSTNGKFDPETNCYQDSKYVKAAGHYLWNAVLIILDAVFMVKTKHHPHPDIIDYKKEIVKRDKKLLTMVNAAYETMHITMGYDGNPSKAVCSGGIQLANEIIDRCAGLLSIPSE